MNWSEIDIGGILLSPIVADGIIAAILLFVLRLVLVHFRLLRRTLHPALVEVCLFVCLLAALVFWV